VKLRDWISRCDRAQRSLPFKVIASVLVAALAIAAFATYYVVVTLPSQQEVDAAAAAQVSAPEPAVQPGAEPTAPAITAEERSAIDAAQKLYRQLMAKRTSPTSLGVGLAAVTAIALAVIWLGLGLTYLALIAVAAGVAFPLWLMGWRGGARLLGGAVALTAAFTALMQALRVAVSGPGPVLAIARNVLAEAVRMKIALVFIVILILGLAYLPGSLSQETPLRYRVQSFLQYGTAASFWIIAALVLFFGAASVAFEQRDKQIWQTMTKPVAPWQYILGKWIGVSGLAAVLLAVCCTGVFLFTEYLRQQPAVGESTQLVTRSGQGLTEDRMILETQVLAARKSVQPVVPMSMDDPEFLRGAQAFIEDNRTRDPEFARDPAMQDKVVSDLFKSLQMRYRTIEPRAYQGFRFTGLDDAKRTAGLLTLRYKIEAGTNAPDTLYKITFNFGGIIHEPTGVTLGNVHTMQLLPAVINEKGEVELAVYNGAVVPGPDGSPEIIPNPGPIMIPADGLELNYSAGSYQMNFLRVAAILWVKLAFLAMLAIAAATFLSFPVACLVAFSVFLIAEGTGFLSLSLEYYDAAQPGEKSITYWKVLVRAIGLAVAWMFKTYSDLRPTTKLVDGKLLAWGSVIWGTVVLACWSAALYGAAVLIFRRRELATYSGR
jgi:ABC-type transport system involved in multi-copper enzyme maturation permease subunit